MRYEKGHKEHTRRHIIETASARFRKKGIESVGLADLMAEAGLTHGGFYSHFASKEELVQEAIAAASSGAQERFHRRIEEGGLEAWIRHYMRPGHRDHPEQGCVVAALAGELARHPKRTRAAFTRNFSDLISFIQSHLDPKQSKTVRRRTAVGIFAVMAGAVQIARAVNDPELSEEILKSGLQSALALAGIPHGTSESKSR